jgi:hypothetical protein
MMTLRRDYTSIDQFTPASRSVRGGHDRNERLTDELARDGNLPIGPRNREIVLNFLAANPGLRKSLSTDGSGSTISKQRLSMMVSCVLENETAFRHDREFVQTLKMLHDSFNCFSDDGRTINL